MQLTAWKDKLLADMNADELRHALCEMWQSYCDVCHLKMTSNAVPEFNFTNERAQAKFRDICEFGMPKAKTTADN